MTDSSGEDLAGQLATVQAALAAADQLDDPGTSPAERAGAVEQVSQGVGAARQVTGWLDRDGLDRLVWAAYHHGGLSMDQVAKLAGYGSGGGRSVRTVQIRLARERTRRVEAMAQRLAQAAATPLAEPTRITLPTPPRRVSASAAADALDGLRSALAVYSATVGVRGAASVEDTQAAVAALADLWGAETGALLAHLGAQATAMEARGT